MNAIYLDNSNKKARHLMSEVIRLDLNFILFIRTMEDTSICGHYIPKDTHVLANWWAVHNDPKLWNRPEEFNPKRFLSDDGRRVIKTELLIPFSIGTSNIICKMLSQI